LRAFRRHRPFLIPPDAGRRGLAIDRPDAYVLGTMERIDITVTGRVQGVAFRHHTVREAESLGVTGWVRNQPDGSVRVVAEGDRDRLERLLAWVGRGPSHARVETCHHLWQQATGEFADFRVAG
jgi:acylphosphatase